MSRPPEVAMEYATRAESKSHRYYPIVLFGIYILIWIWAAIAPTYRDGWWLENILVFVFIPVLIWTYYKFRLSNLSYTLILIFMILHTIGSKYTYAEVPFGFWLQDVFGFTRNNYDRIVHFSFGLMFAYPVREIFLRVANTKGFWAYYFPFELTAAFSCLYEIIEWITAVSINPAAGSAFLGTQGDIWDAQKDMAVASLGAAITMIITAVYNWRYNIHFGKELKDSFKVKEAEPLGEVRLEELKEEKKEFEKKTRTKKLINKKKRTRRNKKK